MTEEDVLIWWITQADCEAIGDYLPDDFPEYLRDEYRSRLGRHGRGRLWSSSLFDPFFKAVVNWPEADPLARVLEISYGGLVLDASDLPLVQQLPGVVTDTKLKRK